MKFRVSLKQLFLFGILATPLWIIALMAWQGAAWARAFLVVPLQMLFVVGMMAGLAMLADVMANVFRRRALTRTSRSRAVPAVAVGPDPNTIAAVSERLSEPMADLQAGNDKESSPQ